MIWLLSYIALGTIAAIIYRWPEDSDGFDLVIDVLFWPIMLYYLITDRG